MNLQEFKDLLIDLLHTTTTRWGALQTALDGYVGFDTVLEQQRKKFLKKGFEFNLMVVGEWILILIVPLILNKSLDSGGNRQEIDMSCRLQ